MSSASGKPEDPLSEHALRQLIRVALDNGYFGESPHATDDHPERGLSIDDVIHGLDREDWAIEKAPNYDGEYRSWEYLIRTVDIEGDELHIKIAAFPEYQRIEVITRW